MMRTFSSHPCGTLRTGSPEPWRKPLLADGRLARRYALTSYKEGTCVVREVGSGFGKNHSFKINPAFSFLDSRTASDFTNRSANFMASTFSFST